MAQNTLMLDKSPIVDVSRTLDEAAVLQRVDELAALVANDTRKAEQRRRITPAVLRSLLASDLVRLSVPASMGGHGHGIELLAEVGRRLGRACPASAWTISRFMQHGWMLSAFPEPTRAEVVAAKGRWPLVSVPQSLSGTAMPVEGGWKIHGRWPWATGISDAEWVIVHAIAPAPSVQPLVALVDRASLTIDDVWHPVGMRACDAGTVVVADAFVPRHRVMPAAELFEARHGAEDHTAGLPLIAAHALVAAGPALGAAEAAVEHLRQVVSTRILSNTAGARLRDQPYAQIRMATAISDLTSAIYRWEQAVSDLVEASASGAVTLTARAAARLSAAATVRSCRAIVLSIGESVGVSGYVNDQPIPKLQRDLEVLKSHMLFDWDRTAEIAGRVALGLPLRADDLL